MSRSGSKSQTSQAFFTTGITGVITAVSLYFCGDDLELLRLVLPAGALCAPFITLLLVRLFAHLNVDAALIKYRSALSRDLKKQKKILKDPLVDEKTKELVREKYSNTSLLLSSANQDHANGAIPVSLHEDSIHG